MSSGITPPDGYIYCCICFEAVPIELAWTDVTGQKWDMCQRCGDAEMAAEAFRSQKDGNSNEGQ